ARGELCGCQPVPLAPFLFALILSLQESRVLQNLLEPLLRQFLKDFLQGVCSCHLLPAVLRGGGAGEPGSNSSIGPLPTSRSAVATPPYSGGVPRSRKRRRSTRLARNPTRKPEILPAEGFLLLEAG